MAEKLNYTHAQEQAIHASGSALLISAAAGSGKTRVLVDRLMRQVLDPSADRNIDDFLVITFTKKAAAELRTRIAKRLGERLAECPNDRHAARQLSRLSLAQITTIDGFCSDLVRRNAFALGVSPDFRQLEQDEAELLEKGVAAAVLEERYTQLKEDPDFRALVDTLGAGRDDDKLEDALLNLYRKSRSHLFPDAWIEHCIRQLDLSQVCDVSRTPWGEVLLRSFRRFCESRADLLDTAVRQCAEEPLLQERYAPVLAEDAAQLRRIGALTAWDEICGAEPVYTTIPGFSKKETSPLQEQLKELRDKQKKALREKLNEFYAPSEVVLAELHKTAAALTALLELARRFERAYRQEKQRLRVLDFSDLEHCAVQLLLNGDRSPKPLAVELSAQFAEIMLDEYQDTNEVQDALFAALSREGKNLFMVGDVKQSIYRFRLADPGIFLEKYRSYAPFDTAEPGQPRKILLSENFRSGPEILEAANAVFTACMSEELGGLRYGEDEKLRLGTPKPKLPEPAVELHCINTKPEGFGGSAPDKVAVEAAFVAERIRQLLADRAQILDGETLRPVEPQDIAILMRSMKHTAQAYADALRARGIPCASDQECLLLEAPEIETLVSLLQLIDNARQDVPLCAVLLSPIVGMSADALARLHGENRYASLYDALRKAEAPEAVRFVALLDRLREAAQTLELPALLQLVVEETGLEERYALLPDGADRQSDLCRFIALAASFSEGGKKSLSQFLAQLEAQSSQQCAPQRQPNAVRLMSIHKSKGLEFPVVVLSDLSRGFNEEELKSPVLLHPTLGAGGNIYDIEHHFHYHSIAKRAIIAQEREDSRSEELRVLYVAMTRPQSRLIMSYCGSELHKKLRQLALRLTLPPKPLLATEAKCPGDWVLEAALLRTEAGELFAAGERPIDTAVSELPWRIRYHEITEIPAAAAAALRDPDAQTLPTPAELEAAAKYVYPCAAAAQTPSKITATQLKGRRIDDEAAEGSATRRSGKHRMRRPCFDEERPLSATERGTATHLAMQYLDFSETGSPEQLAGELQRLTEQAFLTPQQAAAVSPEKLYRVFSGPVGRRIREADEVIREFKFSLLTDAALFNEAAAGERMLLQGVTDCCLIRDGALCVIDFKTDRIRPGEEAAAAERYRGQLDAYALALSRIFALPVKEKLLYFFATDTEFVLTD